MPCSYFYIVAFHYHQCTAVSTSKAPVPVELGRPTTTFPDGLERLSKSPYSVASDMNDPLVSKDALSNGDELVAMPLRLNGL